MVGGVLFQGIAEEEQRTLLDCLQARARHYARGETVLRAGEPTQALGVVVSGSVHIESSDAWGNRSILDKLGPGQIFAEVYACIPGERLMVTVVAAEDTEVLLLRVDRLLEQGTEPTGGRDRLIRNLLEATARKTCISPKKSFTRPRKPSGERCWHICPFSPPGRAAGSFPSPSTDSSWRTIWGWTAAPCPVSWAGSNGRGCWTFAGMCFA